MLCVSFIISGFTTLTFSAHAVDRRMRVCQRLSASKANIFSLEKNKLLGITVFTTLTLGELEFKDRDS